MMPATLRMALPVAGQRAPTSVVVCVCVCARVCVGARANRVRVCTHLGCVASSCRAACRAACCVVCCAACCVAWCVCGYVSPRSLMPLAGAATDLPGRFRIDLGAQGGGGAAGVDAPLLLIVVRTRRVAPPRADGRPQTAAEYFTNELRRDMADLRARWVTEGDGACHA
jgi:hypothetical protein